MSSSADVVQLLTYCCVLLLCRPVLLADEAEQFFEREIRPLLSERCVGCHGAKQQSGGLRLDSREAILRGGDSGPAAVSGDVAASLLVQAIRYDGDLQMPPEQPLGMPQREALTQWVRLGLPWPAQTGMLRATGPDAAAAHWAFQPVADPPIPPADAAQVRTPVDAFLLQGLSRHGLRMSPEADRRTLIRRASFTITGLPPTAAEVAAFVSDPDPRAYERLVERLLHAPEYGQHWARHWLDIARYSDTKGYVYGREERFWVHAWNYRDWVVSALNADMPYDRFLLLQIAADQVSDRADGDLAAMGFLTLGRRFLGVRRDIIDDQIDVVCRGTMALTVACARCHDHKYDPIRTADYYGLAGIFASTRMFNRSLTDKAAKDDAKPEESLHIVREGSPKDLHVFVRGDVENQGPLAPRRFLPILVRDPQPFTEGSGRKQLAEAIVDPGNPLTARVIVNRIWAAYFGRGLVGTLSNFGLMGDRPTHPELLDDLAVRFQQNGWSLKWLHREIVLSATYRQSSLAGSEALAQDPDNLWLSRMPRRRLGAEGWRDSLLAVTGRLDASTVGGPSIDPSDAAQNRRTVYSRISRLDLNRYLVLYDFPDPNVTAEKRSETITPLQKLFVLNSDFMQSQAEALEARLLQAVPGEGAEVAVQRIDWAWRNLFGRPATVDEQRLSEDFLGQVDAAGRWRQFAHVLLASNELQYVD